MSTTAAVIYAVACFLIAVGMLAGCGWLIWTSRDLRPVESEEPDPPGAH